MKNKIRLDETRKGLTVGRQHREDSLLNAASGGDAKNGSVRASRRWIIVPSFVSSETLMTIALLFMVGCAGGNRGTGLRGDYQFDAGATRSEEYHPPSDVRWWHRLFAQRCVVERNGHTSKVFAESELSLGTIAPSAEGSCTFVLEPQSTDAIVTISSSSINSDAVVSVIRDECGYPPSRVIPRSISEGAARIELSGLRLSRDAHYRIEVTAPNDERPAIQVILRTESDRECAK